MDRVRVVGLADPNQLCYALQPRRDAVDRGSGFFVDFIRFLFLDLLKMVGTNKNIIYINISRMVV